MEIELNSGSTMPMAIFGTFEIEQQDMKAALFEGIKCGYTHIDAAAFYRNEADIGEALAEAFSTGLTSRDKLYITTKAWCSNFRRIREGCIASLQRLKLDYLDQYLLHWPIALIQQAVEPPEYSKETLIVDRYPLHLVWAQMEALVEEGLVKSIGVSNWTIALLNDLLGYARILPVTNQFEINPYNQRKELVMFCQQHKIVPVAYRVIYTPRPDSISLLEKSTLTDPLILSLAEKYRKTPGQILLQWCLSRNCAFVMKSLSPSRMAENYSSQFFKLEVEDLEKINAIPHQGVFLEPYQLLGVHLFS